MRKERLKPLVDFTFKSSRSGVVSGPEDQGATATVEVDTEIDRDHRAVMERKHEVGEILAIIVCVPFFIHVNFFQ